MKKLEVQQRVLKNGKPLDLDKFMWDEKTRTFSSEVTGLVLDFTGIHHCTFDTIYDCTFKTGHGCTFKTGSGCTFDTGSDCVIVRRDKFEVIQPKENEEIKLCPFNIKGYLSKQKDKDKWYLNANKELGEHIIADGILSKVINKKGNVYKVINRGDKEESYIVTNGTDFAHGRTIKEAKDDLMYKASNRDTSMYKDYTLETILSKEDMIKMYMLITGACSLGTKSFVESHEETKDYYSIEEIIELTKGQFGNEEFKEFFN